MYLPTLKSVALPVPEIIAIEVLDGGCKLPILGKRRPNGVGDGTFLKRPSTVTFPLSLRVPEILLLLRFSCLLYTSPSPRD